MKLWQKIFLLSLAFVMFSVSGTALFVAQSYFSLMIRREKANAATQHEYISSGISNRVSFERLRSSELVLSDEDIKEIIEEMVASQTDSDSGIAIFDSEKEIASSNASMISALHDFMRQVKSGEEARSVISDYFGRTYLSVGSSFTLEGSRYYLFTSSDVSSIYENHTLALNFIRVMSLVFAGVTSVVLLFAVYRMFRPFERINASIRMIANGDYGERVEEKGGLEFRELSHNVNQMADSIEENIESLQGIADSRKRFTDNLAHEMKTPLTSIICLADVLRIKKKIPDGERIEYADIIVEEAKRLKNLSGKLLELTVASNAELDFRDVSLPDILAEIQTAVAPIFEKNRLNLNIVSVNVTVHCDKDLFSSMLFNLIDNARKASSPGNTVEVRCSLSGKTLTIAVADEGVGMSRAELRRVTEPFYMADKSRSRKLGGAGLGLSLCMEIARRHSADLKIRSKPGIGTIVFMTVPVGGETNE